MSEQIFNPEWDVTPETEAYVTPEVHFTNHHVNPKARKAAERILANAEKSDNGRTQAANFIRVKGFIPSYSGSEKIMYIKPSQPNCKPNELLQDMKNMYPAIEVKYVG